MGGPFGQVPCREMEAVGLAGLLLGSDIRPLEVALSAWLVLPQIPAASHTPCCLGAWFPATSGQNHPAKLMTRSYSFIPACSSLTSFMAGSVNRDGSQDPP